MDAVGGGGVGWDRNRGWRGGSALGSPHSTRDPIPCRQRPPSSARHEATCCAGASARPPHTSVAYRLVMVVRGLGSLVVLAALAGALACGTGGAAPERAKLRLDGVRFNPELALTQDQRAVGLMKRRRAPKDGMLFVFPRDTTGGFWMKNTLVPLTIAFFNADGKRVRKLSMTPCKADPCRVYYPGRRYRFALELRASDKRKAAKLGPLRELRRLVRLAG